VPIEARSWLFDPSSLTARLIRKYSGDFHVELLSQEVNRPTLDEIKALNLNYGDSALIREVQLCCGGKAVVYARTVIPLSTLTGAQNSYGNLGNRPLGAMLFADKSMKRDEVMVTRLVPECTLYKKTGASKDDVWGRRSVFHVGGKPLLVSEYYLPTLYEN
jgi:chorismate--pyruvate lyase